MSEPVAARCACGELIVCIADEIPFGVAAHNATTPHQRWRARGGMEWHLEHSSFETDEEPWDGYEHRPRRQRARR